MKNFQFDCWIMRWQYGHHLDLADRRAVAHVVEGDLGVAEELQQRRPVGGEAGEDEAAVAVDPRRALDVAVGVRLVHRRALVAARQRDGAHLAVEVEAPGVVRADEGAAGVALQVADELHAAVRAAVVQHVDGAVGGAHHHHRLAADRHRVVVAGVRDLRLVAAVDPDLLEDVLHLACRRSAGRCRRDLWTRSGWTRSGKFNSAIARHPRTTRAERSFDHRWPWRDRPPAHSRAMSRDRESERILAGIGLVLLAVACFATSTPPSSFRPRPCRS